MTAAFHGRLFCRPWRVATHPNDSRAGQSARRADDTVASGCGVVMIEAFPFMFDSRDASFPGIPFRRIRCDCRVAVPWHIERFAGGFGRLLSGADVVAS